MLASIPLARRVLGFVSAALLGAACGGTADAPVREADTPPLPPDAPATSPPAAPAPLDHGSPSATYPAFTPDMARLVNRGGHVMTNPVVVTVTFPGDANADTFEKLGDTIGASPYWKAVTGEYGIGAAVSGPANHVRVGAPLDVAPPSDPNQDPVAPVAAWLAAQLADPAASHFPAPTDQTIYTLYLSGKVADALCADGAGGLHDAVEVGGKPVAYALVLECFAGSNAGPSLDDATISASHELAEAATDPFPDASPGWQGLDRDHLAWELMQMGQDENGDMCELYDDAYGQAGAPELAWTVQRQWSNASAAAGHSPCVPAANEPYFNVVALGAADPVTADFSKYAGELPPFDPTSKGVRVPVGGTAQIPIGFYSDGPTEPIELEAYESDPFDDQAYPMSRAAHATLDLSLDRTSGQNGEKAYLTIHVNEAPAIGVALVVLRTRVGGVSHYMPLLVGR